MAGLVWLMLALPTVVGLGAEEGPDPRTAPLSAPLPATRAADARRAGAPARLPPVSDQHRPLAQASHQADRRGLPLTKPSRTTGWPRATGALRSVSSLFAALGAVIALLLATLWALRRFLPKDKSLLPGEVFEVLGRRPLAGRQQAQVVRFGNKLVLLAVSPLGAEPLAEITETAEVERLAALCRQPASASSAAAFRQVFDELAREPARPGFVGEGQARALKLAVRELGQRKPPEATDA